MMDRVSELPQGLIHHILSFLPLGDAVSTTILSKTWNNLWTTAPCLNFRVYMEDNHNYLVNEVVKLWKGTKIRRFEIFCIPDSSSVGDVNSWVRFAAKNDVKELRLDVGDDDDYEYEYEPDIDYCVPESLSSCSSIRELSFVGLNLQINGSPSWNHLKTLLIQTNGMSDCLINRIMLGSPRLEDFRLSLMDRDFNENLNIRSQSLKKLWIDRYLYFYPDQSGLDKTFRIYCPNLEILEFCGGLDGRCVIEDIWSKIDATLYFDAGYDCDDYGVCLNELFGVTLRQAFSEAPSSAWCDGCYKEITISRPPPKKLPPPLPHVNGLKLDVRHIKFGDVMDLLGIFPNLKMLEFGFISNLIADEFGFLPNLDAENYMEFESNLSNPFLLQLEKIEITSNFSDFSIFGFIEFMLKRAVRLQKFVIRTKCGQEKLPLFQIAEKLLSMPRSSPTAKVILKDDAKVLLN